MLTKPTFRHDRTPAAAIDHASSVLRRAQRVCLALRTRLGERHSERNRDFLTLIDPGEGFAAEEEAFFDSEVNTDLLVEEHDRALGRMSAVFAAARSVVVPMPLRRMGPGSHAR